MLAGLDRIGRAGDCRDAAERRRLTCLVLAGPFLIAAASWMLLPARIGMDGTAVLTLVSLAAALASVVFTARLSFRLGAALTLMAGQLGLVAWAAGGLASPIVSVLALLPIEAWMATRRRSAVITGLGLAALAMAGVGIAETVYQSGTASAWQWLLPLIYAASVAARVPFVGAASEETAADHETLPDFGALRLRFAPNGDLKDAGKEVTELFGVAPEFVTGTAFFDRIHVADRVPFLCALSDLRAGAPAARVELRLRVARPDAPEMTPTYRDFVLELAPNGATGDFFGLLRDNRIAAELKAALARAQEAAGELQAAKTQFLASVSHELRTPLNSIIGFADMLDCGVSGPLANERQKENVATIKEAGQHLLGVVNSILEVSRMEAGAYEVRPEPFAFSEAANFCCQMMAPQAAGRGVTLIPPAPGGHDEVVADRRAIQQILINLVSNAVKFTPAGGSVTVGLRRQGGRLRFWVSDTGIGIADADLGRIGRPFAQVQNDYARQFDGLGLGLALVKGLVSLHEGTMSIESTLGAGTTVTITLPLNGPARSGDVQATIERGIPEAVNGALRKAG